jgi:hypothetical protein
VAFIISLLSLLFSLFLCALIGFGLSTFFVTKSLNRFRLILSPVLGFLWIVGFVPFISAATQVSFKAAIDVSLVIAFGMSFGSIFREISRVGFINFIRNLIVELKEVPAVALSLSLLTFSIGALLQGFNNFWGTVNPDFLQSWSFLESLISQNFNFYSATHISGQVNLFSNFFPDQLQARFGGVAFAGMLSRFGFATPKGGLTITIVLGLVILALVVSVYYKVCLKNRKDQTLALRTFTVGAPIGMSMIFVFVGQNSTLFMFPLVLVITQVYLDEKRKELRLLVLVGLIFVASLFAYIPILPLLVALFGLSLLFWSASNRIPLRKFMRDIVILAAIFAIITLIGWRISKTILRGYFALISILDVSDTNVIYFSEWHSLSAFPYFLGASTSPISNSLIAKFFLSPYPLVIFSIFIAGLSLWGSLHLIITQSNLRPSILAALFVFLGLTIYYATFLKYGYAEFKLSSWFFFMIPLGLAALGSVDVKTVIQKRLKKIFSVLILIFFCLNLFNSIEYGRKSMGLDSQFGTIVNSYGQSSAKQSIDRVISFIKSSGKTHQVALGLPFVESEIMSAYLRRTVSNITMLSHQALPLDDKYLLDFNGNYVDLSGTSRKPSALLDVTETPDWVILPSRDNPNQDIIVNGVLGIPKLSTAYYNVYSPLDLERVTVTGRGFGREEYAYDQGRKSIRPLRWSFNGFELVSYFNTSVSKPFNIKLKIHFDPRISHDEVIRLYVNNQYNSSYRVYGDSLLMVKTSSLNRGVNRFVFRWDTQGCDFDPKNQRNLKWCNYAEISQIEIDGQHQSEIPLGVTYDSATLQSIANTYSGIRQDGWFQGTSSAEWSIAPTAKQCQIALVRDGSNTKLTINPLLTLSNGDTTSVVPLDFGISNISFIPRRGGDKTILRLSMVYPAGSTDSSDPKLQISKGSVRLVSVACR